jgi:hypothetical protein
MASRKIQTKSSPRATNYPRTTVFANRQVFQLPQVIGLNDLPEHMPITERKLYNSTLMMSIQPCKPCFEEGMNLFRLDEDWDEYVKYLGVNFITPNAVQTSSKSIRVAAMVDSLPTDTFTNEYGEHFLNKITDVAGSAFGEAAQMMGKTSGTDALKDIGKAIGGSIGSGIESLAKGAEDFTQNLSGTNNKLLAGMGDIANKLIAGARVDFPMIWKNSSYSSSYSFTIRLYNPKPGAMESTKHYIINPLIALLTLAIPRSELESDISVYRWPFFIKVDCPGLFAIQSGAITNVTVQKGGEAGLIAYNQRLGMVDVKIDMINLYSTMINTDRLFNIRPSLFNYATNLIDEKNLETNWTKAISESTEIDITNESLTQTVIDTSSEPESRINETSKEITDILQNNQPIVSIT